jgi:hypothetical protein
MPPKRKNKAPPKANPKAQKKQTKAQKKQRSKTKRKTPAKGTSARKKQQIEQPEVLPAAELQRLFEKHSLGLFMITPGQVNVLDSTNTRPKAHCQARVRKAGRYLEEDGCWSFLHPMMARAGKGFEAQLAPAAWAHRLPPAKGEVGPTDGWNRFWYLLERVAAGAKVDKTGGMWCDMLIPVHVFDESVDLRIMNMISNTMNLDRNERRWACFL